LNASSSSAASAAVGTAENVNNALDSDEGENSDDDCENEFGNEEINHDTDEEEV
jgi:hypothetical protein